MALFGTYKGNAIVTDRAFAENQSFLLIPVDRPSLGKLNENKLNIIEKLYGSVPNSGYSLETTREERLSKQ